MRFQIVAAAILCAATPALAEMERSAHHCVFETECFDADCMESGYTLDLEVEIDTSMGKDKHLAYGKLTDPAQTLDLRGMSNASGLQLAEFGQFPFALLSLSPEGSARFSTHIPDGPMVITYLGRCEPAQ